MINTDIEDLLRIARLLGSRAFWLQFSLCLMLALLYLLWPRPAHASNGQCKWENGPGAPQYAQCDLEDCMGAGGRALCSAPEIRPTNGFSDAQTDGQKFVYGTYTPSEYDNASWCQAAGGQFNGFGGSGGLPECSGLDTDVHPGSNPYDDNDESLVLSIASAGMNLKYNNCAPTVQSDTGWGLGTSTYIGGSGYPIMQNGQIIQAVRDQVFALNNGCNGTVLIEYIKQRQLFCPDHALSRTLPDGSQQCVIPPCCEKTGNPVSLVTGGKSAKELDYQGPGPGGLVLAHYYSSDARFALPATGAFIGTASSYWRFSYQRHLMPVTGNSTFSAILTHEDGRLEEFDGSGNEILNIAGAADRLASNGSAGWTLALADGSVETYNSSGNLTSSTSLSGLVTTVVYGANGQISQVSDAFGHKFQYIYNGAGQLASVTLPDGSSTISYGYNSLGAVQSVTYPDQTSRTYQYEDPNNSLLLTGITDESAQRFATYVYDAGGGVLHEEHAGGVDAYDFSVGSGGYSETVAAVTDPLGQYRQYVLDDQAGVFKLRYATPFCPDCPNISGSSFDANGNYQSKTDPNNNQTTYTFDLTRNLELSRTEGISFGSVTAAARTITTQWHPSFRLPTLVSIYAGAANTGTPLRTTSFSYDNYGNLLSKAVTDGATSATRTWNYSYYNSGQSGQLQTASGPRTDLNDAITYTYYSCSNGNGCGQIQTISNALGHTTTFDSYDANGLPLTITDPNGVLTTLTYDARQRLLSRQVGTEITAFAYYPTGLLQTVTMPDGSTLRYTYDGAHRLTKIQDGLGNSVQYSLDAMGNRTAQSTYDPSNVLSTTRSNVYNSLDELSQQIGAAGTAAVTTAFSYDPGGNQTAINAPLSRNTTNAYDALNRLSQVTDPGNGITSFSYDVNDSMVSVTDPNDLTTSYQYNGLGDLLRLISPARGTTTNTYDSAGNLATSHDARGVTATYTYDALNRVTQVAYGDQTIAYGYDAGANGKGHLTGASDSAHSMGWQYDALGRITSKTQIVAGRALTVGYAYSSADPTTLTTPSGQAIHYSYSNHQITGITVNSTTLLSGIVYDPFGPARGWSWGNGTSESRLHDTDGNPSQFSAIESTSYSVDSAFRIVGLTNASNSALSWTDGYDSLDRLTNATQTATALTWGYDADGNRTSQTGAASPGYSAVPLGMTYNNRDRMGSVTAAGITTNYVYNALGQRIEKSAAAVTLFAYDEAGHLIGEYDSGGNLIEETVWLGDLPVATLRPHSGGGIDIDYIHADHLNTPKMVTRSADNAILWRWDQDPFGTTAPNQNPSGAGVFVYNLRFPGQYYDQETGLNYNDRRDYDSTTGRFIESDPIGLAGGSYSTYAYAGGNPVSFADPSGLQRADPHPYPPTYPGYVSPADAAWNQAVNNATNAIDDAVQNGANAVANYLHNLCDDDCPEIVANINRALGVLRVRYLDALVDKDEFYTENPIGANMSWLSHRLEYEAQQRNLRRQINRAKAKGCVYDPTADIWANKPYPESPVRWMGGPIA